MWMLYDDQFSVCSEHSYYGSQVYVWAEFPGTSTAQFIHPRDWHLVVNKLSRFLVVQKNSLAQYALA